MKWSTFQSDIFNFVSNGDGNAIVEAVAGSGKTTTIVEAMSRIPPTHNSIFLAFNKAIATELKSRGVNGRTFHSLGCSATMKALGSNQIAGDKTRKLAYEHFEEEDAFLYSVFLSRLVGLGKQIGIGALVEDDPLAWWDIIEHHDLELDKDGADMHRAVELASQLLTLSNESNVIDFDDMLYLPVLMDLALPKFAFIFVDEGQDTNAIQRELLRKIMGRNSRLVVVGDPAQAIYGFRGADSNSLNCIAKEFNCVRFPLSVSYRCGTKIVNHARKWVDHIQPADAAPEGAVINLNYDWDVDTFAKDDLIVCRTTKPLISLAFRMLRQRIPATVMGREIGQGLVKLIKKFNAKDLAELSEKCQVWADKEIAKSVANMNEGKAAAISDKNASIQILIDDVEMEGGNVQSLINVIEDLFTPSRDSVTLATIHKAKGLEAETVYWLNSSQCPSRWARKGWQKQQEFNLCYVATTRARTGLFLIEEEQDPEAFPMY